MAGKRNDSGPSARELILTLMDSTTSDTLGASYFVAAGALFGMDPGSIRVALARLVRDGALVAVKRGRYGLGNRRGVLQTLVRNWGRAEAGLRPWTGGWLTVITAHQARADRTRLRGNERALKLLGFAAAATGLWVRPANLAKELDHVRNDLLDLGLNPESVCARVERFTPEGFLDPATLWDTDALNRRYQANLRRLAASRQRLDGMDPLAAARETLLLGREVTRDILLDPLLPDELVDGGARRRMIRAMRGYDRIGKKYWRAFYRRHESGASAPHQKPAA